MGFLPLAGSPEGKQKMKDPDSDIDNQK